MLTFLAAVLLALPCVFGDTPANCTYEDAVGVWEFGVSDNREECLENATVGGTVQIQLLYPNLAIDALGREGTWTIIYNQGFEINLAHRKWLVKYAYLDDETYYCDRGMPMWTHDTLMRQWNCSVAHKVGGDINSGQRQSSLQSILSQPHWDENYKPDHEFVAKINAAQKLWIATEYPQHVEYTLRDHLWRAGGLSIGISRPMINYNPRALTEKMTRAISRLPRQFDWRYDAQGVVTPVRDQWQCGSCYAFASVGAMESRIRIASNVTETPILSPQDVVDCSPYSEGCDGGFLYLTAGKYAEDFGIVTEDCIPYEGEPHGFCPSKKGCKRYYSTNYRYVGGYYGATNAQLMQLELVENGPLPVAFEVYYDFFHYKSGIYIHTGIKSTVNRFDPFVLTNHAVLLVGYGVEDGVPYWTVKNSWSDNWGDHGYFKILRGSDECGIESCALAFDPLL